MGIELWRNLEGHLFRELGLLHAAATYSPIPTIYLKPNQLSSRTVEELDILLNLLPNPFSISLDPDFTSIET